MGNISVSIFIVTISFLLYHFLSGNGKLKTYMQFRFGEEQGQIRSIIFNRLLGAFLFAATALFNFVNKLPISGSEINIKYKPLLFLIFLFPIIINKFAAKGASNLAMYPQIRAKVWSKNLIIISAISWLAYLLGYEIMFRGVLFYNCLNEMDLFSAIIINISIYSLVHIPKGFNETIGALPMGIILCFLTWFTGSIWAAFVLHSLLALTNEWFSLKYNSEMKISQL